MSWRRAAPAARFSLPAPPVHPPALPDAPALEASYRSLVNSLPARAARAGGAAAVDAGADVVARRRLGRLRAPAPQPRAADVRRAGARRRLLRQPRGSRALRARAPLRRLHLAAARSHAGRQVAPDEVLHELSELFGRRWRDAIADATGEEPLTDLLCRRSTALWRRGTTPGADSCWRRDRCGCPSTRRWCARSWAGSAVPSQALLLVDGDSDRLESFLRGARSVPARPAGDRRRDRSRAGSRAARRRRAGPRSVARRARCCGWRPSWCSGRRRRPRAAGSPGWRPGWTRSRARSARGASAAKSWPTRSTRSASSGEIEETVVGRGELPSAAPPTCCVSPCLSVAAVLRPGARVERAPVRVREPVRALGGRSRRRRACAGVVAAGAASAGSTSIWRRRGADATRPSCRRRRSSPPSAAAAAAATTSASTATSAWRRLTRRTTTTRAAPAIRRRPHAPMFARPSAVARPDPRRGRRRVVRQRRGAGRGGASTVRCSSGCPAIATQ